MYFYVDCGANIGNTIQDWLNQHTDSYVIAFEPENKLSKYLKKIFSPEKVVIYAGACGTYDGKAKFYRGKKSSQSSTLVEGKISKCESIQVNYDDFELVDVYDINRVILEHFNSYFDRKVIKIDIEGGEYSIIPYMIETGCMKLFDEVRVDWHYSKFNINKNIPDKVYNSLLRTVKNVVNWK